MENKNALVIGGGVAGVTSALELTKNGFKVYLVEKEATVGGQAASFSCKATDTCAKCSVCVVPPKIKEAVTHPQISLLTNAAVQEVSGEVGNFRVEVMQKPQYVDAERCIACGLCVEVCPTKPKAVYLTSPDARPLSYVLNERLCLRFKGEDCNLCHESCPTQAINFGSKLRSRELDVGAIIVATGFEVFNAKKKGPLGYGCYPSVLTGLDLEKMFRREGILKPPGGKKPKDIAFIQCVGSRDESQGKGYCSQVCCKYAMRFARLLKYQDPEVKVTIFYIDLQTAGKGFAEFYEECRDIIRFVRGVPVEVSEATNDKLKVRFEDFSQGMQVTEAFDVVVLSVGIAPKKDSWALAKVLGLNLDEFGFFDSRDGVETNVAGIFLAGTCQGPKAIPESIAHGAAAAERTVKALSSQRVGKASRR